METDHIVSCVRLIRWTGWRVEYLEVMEAELRDRGAAFEEDPKDFDLGDAFALAVSNARGD